MNMSKGQVVEKLDLLQEHVDLFERKKKFGEIMVVSIVNIGFMLNVMGNLRHAEIVKNLNYKHPLKGNDESIYDERYVLTHLGQPIGLCEYSTRLARSVSTHVILLEDWDASMDLLVESYIVDSKEDFNEVILSNRPGRRRLSYVPKCSIIQLV